MAYLNEDTHEIEIFDQTAVIGQVETTLVNEHYSLFSELGPFKQIMSSSLLLGIVPETENSELTTSLIFSLWTEPLPHSEGAASSLLNFPLIFSAQQWGYESVNLHQIIGTHAVVSLRSNSYQEDSSPSSSKGVWGVYSVLNAVSYTHLRAHET